MDLFFESLSKITAPGNLITRKQLDELTFKIIGYGLDTHNILLTGNQTSNLLTFFTYKLQEQGLSYDVKPQNETFSSESKKPSNIYHSLIVENLIFVELILVDDVSEAMKLKLKQTIEEYVCMRGILLNFNSRNLYRDGVIIVDSVKLDGLPIL